MEKCDGEVVQVAILDNRSVTNVRLAVSGRVIYKISLEAPVLCPLGRCLI